MSSAITENAVDLIKSTVVMAPPISVGLFGVSLESWMMIASIVASLFILLDKIPAVWERYRVWSKKQGSNSGSSSPDDLPPR